MQGIIKPLTLTGDCLIFEGIWISLLGGAGVSTLGCRVEAWIQANHQLTEQNYGAKNTRPLCHMSLLPFHIGPHSEASLSDTLVGFLQVFEMVSVWSPFKYPPLLRNFQMNCRRASVLPDSNCCSHFLPGSVAVRCLGWVSCFLVDSTPSGLSSFFWREL